MKILKKLLPVVIISAGLFILVFMTMLRPEPEKEEREILLPVVKTKTYSPQNIKMDVEGSGVVRSSLSIDIVSQVGGTITSVSPDMKDGGFFKKGEVLFRIDPREYKLRVQSAQAEVKRQKLALAKEKAESELAKKEWESFNKNSDSTPSDLVLRTPQLESAKSAFESAVASLKLAELNLEKTVIRAPFTGRVLTRFTGKGQFVGPGTNLASIYSQEVMEVVVSVEDKKLRWLDLNNKKPPVAEVSGFFSGKKGEWIGKVKRVAAKLDERNRLPRIIIEIPDSYNTDNPPLIPNMFVQVKMEGIEIENSFLMPEKHIHNKSLYIEKEGLLEIRNIEISAFLGENAVITGGLEENESIVVSPLSNPVNGMKVKRDGVR
ncbi:MAG: efflux RND transporter periplasmic adaptor subunit [bacterium]